MSAVITLVCVILLLLALKLPETIIWLNLLAFGGLEAVFLWLLVLGLYGNAPTPGAKRGIIVRRRAVCRTLATLNIQYLGFT